MTSQCNGTAIMEFFLMGFQGLHRSRIVIFLPILLIYIVTVGANLLIIFLVSTSHLVHCPMYFFLCHLSLCDFFFSTNIVPKMMQVTLEGGSTISFSGCFIQFYVFGSCTGTECFLLSAMSYDRYLAICHPLRYTSIMDLRLCVHLAVCCWFLSFFFVLITLVLISMLRFCDKNIIDHFYCDFMPILELSCTDTSAVEIETTFFAYVIVLLPFLMIVGSYFNICLTILGISSGAERKRAFSTCSSHLTIVSSYYGSLLSIYLVPSQGHSLNMNKFLSLLYTFVTPLINPIIYSLRNREIRNQCSRLFLRFRGEPLG